MKISFLAAALSLTVIFGSSTSAQAFPIFSIFYEKLSQQPEVSPSLDEVIEVGGKLANTG